MTEGQEGKARELRRRMELELHRPTIQLLFIITAVTLVTLPFITTFNEFLTAIVIWLRLDGLLGHWVVPLEARMVAPLLQIFGVSPAVTPSGLLLNGGATSVVINISWNCVGWQSFILFAITVITGMQGPYSVESKIHTVILGILGTILLNLYRVASVSLIAFYFGSMPAIVYHDYAGTLMVLAWLALFWWGSHRYLLEPDKSEIWEEDGAEAEKVAEE